MQIYFTKDLQKVCSYLNTTHTYYVGLGGEVADPAVNKNLPISSPNPSSLPRGIAIFGLLSGKETTEQPNFTIGNLGI